MFRWFTTIFLLLLTLSGCAVAVPKKEKTQYQPDFHYQLQNASFEELKRLPVSYLIVDPDDAQLTSAQLEELEQTGKKTLAYLSIGEAEDYRAYWQKSWRPGSPAFIDAENPAWQGNFKVKYWDPRWQEIIKSRLKTIVQTGYDGVYLDIIDAYEYYAERREQTAKADMIQFVKTLADSSRTLAPDFLIVAQNAVELYANQSYQDIIDGLGKEDTWYDDDVSLPSATTIEALVYLDAAHRDGKKIFAIDYPIKKERICIFYRLCRAHQFFCTVSNRTLDQGQNIDAAGYSCAEN